MKAASVICPGSIDLRELPVPQLQSPDQVLVKVRRVGICGSDVHIFQGENPFATYPRVFGHEFAGEIVAVGENVTELAPGDHVVGEPIESCGQCYACRNHRPNVCEKLQVMGVHIEGGCREYLTLDAAKAHKISREVPWSIAVLTEPMTIGLQATSRGRVQKGDVVLIMGSGTIGLCNLIAAKAAGATVVTTDILPEKLEYAKKLGADYVVDVTREDLSQRLREITGGSGPNVVLDCVCNRSSLEQAVELVSAAGRVVELGFGPISSQIPHVTLMKKEVDLVGTRLQANKFSRAVALVEQNQELLRDFVTQEFPLDQVAQAFDLAISHPEKVRKILISL